MTNFDAIRPYNDNEVGEVLTRLLANDDFIKALCEFKLPGAYNAQGQQVIDLVRRQLSSELEGVQTVHDLQLVVERYLSDLIESQTGALTYSGLEASNLTSVLFMSNHRDIVMDPAFVNWALFHSKRDTVRIAIGDNLLSEPFVEDLMRLNKSFIVTRTAATKREQFRALTLLSAYIRHSLDEDHANIWIAQREGRAKDGDDRTEPAVLKMIGMSKDKGQSIEDFLATRHIVPVSISYEFDPCDILKAKELYYRDTQGSYQKSAGEDELSIALGISGYKGDVHIAFGTPVQSADSVEAMAAEIDRQIINNYVLHPTNFIAYQMIHGSYPDLPCGVSAKPFDISEHAESEALFKGRLDGIDAHWRQWVINAYAKPVLNKLAL